jgi:MerR family transcriptional regulator, light-induced transcriptional regulator
MSQDSLTQVAARLAQVLPQVAASATQGACRRAPGRWLAQETACMALLGQHAHALTLALALREPAMFEACVRGVLPLLGLRAVGTREVCATLRDLADALQQHLGAEDAAVAVPLVNGVCARLTESAGRDSHQRLLQALLAGDVEEARACVQAGLAHGHLYVYEHLVQPALEAVGELWRAHSIGVADEHLATAVARTVVASLYPGFPWPRGGPRALVACVQGELHDFGVQLLADLLALEGWDVQSLGADTPTVELVRWVHRVKPVFVGLSVCMPERLAEAARAARVLRTEAPGVPLILGGQALRTPGIAAPALGVDVLARGASEALERVSAWRA